MHKLFQTASTFFARLGPRWVLLLSAFLVLLLGIPDYLTGYEITFSFFYLIPIVIATLYGNLRIGLFMVGLSIFIWTFANLLAGETHSNDFIWLWNAGIRLVTFAGIAYIVYELNLSIEHENLLSRTDFLTGINNTREFYRLASLELQRARHYGHSFSIAYLDLDNFKQVNDQFGHSMGDEILRLTAQAVVSGIRKGDMFARLGGDEFVLLLPDTDSREVRHVAEKVHSIIGQTMAERNVNVTVSMGVATFTIPPNSIDELIKTADKLMYQSKSSGKNTILFQSIDPQG